MGVKAMKDFHLRDPAQYDKDIKDKIFFIAQNALGGNEKLVTGTVANMKAIESQRTLRAKQ